MIEVSDDIKIKGLIKSTRGSGIFLLQEGKQTGAWWYSRGTAKDYIKKELIGEEVTITIMNQKKKTFSYIEKYKE